MSEVKKRTANFTAEESELLLELVSKYKNIIECKETDRVSWCKKRDTWLEIAKEFNAVCGKTFRDASVLKKKFENMKKTTKKKYAQEKCALYGTGGGPSLPSTITSEDEKLKELMGIQVVGLQAVYDNDAITASSTANNIGTSKEESQSNWTRYSPSMLRQPISQELAVQEDGSLEEVHVDDCEPLPDAESKSKEQRNVDRTPSCKSSKGKVKAYAGSNAWEQLAKEKIELVQLKKQLVLKEHELKQQHMCELKEQLLKEHELKIQHMCELNELAKIKLQLEIEFLKRQ